ncbi:Signal-induced proliferation-associated 1-like protein 2 [Irineochytrium annulatum]|nr:Signal-induced proliferation-associated 1-like protein 2 [Irineochytrium annulatum]
MQDSNCCVCQKKVYYVEGVVFASRSYHKSCFKCQTCRKPLTLSTVAPHGGEPFCAYHGLGKGNGTSLSSPHLSLGRGGGSGSISNAAAAAAHKPLRSSPSLSSISAVDVDRKVASGTFQRVGGFVSQRVRAFTSVVKKKGGGMADGGPEAKVVGKLGSRVRSADEIVSVGPAGLGMVADGIMLERSSSPASVEWMPRSGDARPGNEIGRDAAAPVVTSVAVAGLDMVKAGASIVAEPTGAAPGDSTVARSNLSDSNEVASKLLVDAPTTKETLSRDPAGNTNIVASCTVNPVNQPSLAVAEPEANAASTATSREERTKVAANSPAAVTTDSLVDALDWPRVSVTSNLTSESDAVKDTEAGDLTREDIHSSQPSASITPKALSRTGVLTPDQRVSVSATTPTLVVTTAGDSRGSLDRSAENGIIDKEFVESPVLQQPATAQPEGRDSDSVIIHTNEGSATSSCRTSITLPEIADMKRRLVGDASDFSVVEADETDVGPTPIRNPRVSTLSASRGDDGGDQGGAGSPGGPGSPLESMSQSEALDLLARDVKCHATELCDLYDSLASNPAKKFSVDIVSLILRSVTEGARRVLALAAPLVKVSALVQQLKNIEDEFGSEGEVPKPSQDRDPLKWGVLLRKAVDSTVGVAAIEEVILEYKTIERQLFVRSSTKFRVEVVGNDLVYNYASYKLEHLNFDAQHYRRFFQGHEHGTFVAKAEQGYLIVNIRREKISAIEANWEDKCDKEPGMGLSVAIGSPSLSHSHLGHSHSQAEDSSSSEAVYRIIIRSKGAADKKYIISESVFPHSVLHTRPSTKAILQHVDPGIQLIKLSKACDSNVEKKLLSLDEINYAQQYKIGVLYCKEGQQTEEELFGNETGSPAFDVFLSIIGEAIDLKGFPGFLGGLDNKNNNTGEETVHTEWKSFELTFHVSTLLPYFREDPQQIQRKRHIGNDIVCLVFLDGPNATFDPLCIRSQFLHVFIIVKEERSAETGQLGYRIVIATRNDVPDFGPPLPTPPVFYSRVALREFLMAKIVNGENAAMKAPKLRAPQERTRAALFDEIVSECLQTARASSSHEREPSSPSLTVMSPSSGQPSSQANSRRPSARGSLSRGFVKSETELPIDDTGAAAADVDVKKLKKVRSVNRIDPEKSKTDTAVKSSTALANGDDPERSEDYEDDKMGDDAPPSAGRKFSKLGFIRRASHNLLVTNKKK